MAKKTARQSDGEEDLLGSAGGDLANFITSKGAGKNAMDSLEIDIDLVDEDPDNVRKSMDPDTLRDLGISLKTHGFLAPISVRENPADKGRYIVNTGNRRCRAAKEIGLKTIPVVIRNAFSDELRVIENIHRDNLSASEISTYIERKMSEGMNQTSIAKLLDKSISYVNQFSLTIKASDTIRDALDSGQITDITTASELSRIEKKDPGLVKKALKKNPTINRATVSTIKEALTGKKDEPEAEKPLPGKVGSESDDIGDSKESGSVSIAKKHGPAGSGVITVMHGRSCGVLQPDRPSDNELMAWVQFEKGDKQVNVSSLKIIRITH